MTDQPGNAAPPDADSLRSSENGRTDLTGRYVVPLLSETATVSRRKVDTGIVQVATVTRSREALVDEPVVHERVEVERIPVGRIIDTVPPVREEGDTTIIPVVEEIVVVERRLVLKEEVHLRRVRVTEQHRETVVLREQEAVVTRSKPDVGTGREGTNSDGHAGPDA